MNVNVINVGDKIQKEMKSSHHFALKTPIPPAIKRPKHSYYS